MGRHETRKANGTRMQATVALQVVFQVELKGGLGISGIRGMSITMASAIHTDPLLNNSS